MKFITFILALAISTSAVAQTKTYEVSDDESQKQNLMCYVSLLDFNLGQPTLSFGAGFGAEYFIKRLSLEGNYHFAYYDMKKSLIAGTNESSNKLKGYKDWRLGGRLHFIDKVGHKTMKANLSYEVIGSTTHTTYLPVKMPTRKIVALHFGMQRYNTPIKARRDSGVTATDGYKLSEWASGTNLGVNMLYAGFSFINIMKARCNIDGSHWNFKWYKHLYFDFLFAPLVTVQDIEYNGKSYDVQGTGARGFRTTPLGGRFGLVNMSKNILIRYEIGMLPGLAGRGFYTSASFGWSIVKAIKPVTFKKK